MHQKLVPGPCLILVNSPNSHCMQGILLRKGTLKEDYQKALSKLTLFFLWNIILFNEQDHEKQKGSETSDQSLIRLQN